MGEWISADLLNMFPDGPYAVHVYFPGSGREYVTRNLSPGEAATQAESEASRDSVTFVHVSLDTCG